VPVQAICNGKVIDGTLSDEGGKYRFINLKPGRYQIRYYTLNGYYGSNTSSAIEGKVVQVEPGKRLKNLDFRFAPFKKGTWRNYTYLDGLADNYVGAIHRGHDGVLWFATISWTGGHGVSRYDGNQFVTFTEQNGLAHNYVNAIHCDPDGVMWFGTQGGVSRYDGKQFVSLTSKDGLAHNYVNAIHCDPDGVMWFGTRGGVSRYDGKQFGWQTTVSWLSIVTPMVSYGLGLLLGVFLATMRMDSSASPSETD
jgi:ligand-binding sensor domain-containing protein